MWNGGVGGGGGGGCGREINSPMHEFIGIA